MKKLSRKQYLIIALLLFLVLGVIYFSYRQERYIAKMELLPVGWGYGLKAQIEGKPYFLQIDTGAIQHIDLHEDVLETIQNKKFVGSYKWYDINNNEYNSDVYRMGSDIEFNRFTVHTPLIRVEPKKFVLEGTVIKFKSKNHENISPKPALAVTHGRISTSVLKAGKYWFIDFPQKSIWLIKDLEKVKKNEDLIFENFVEIDMLPDSDHLVISVKTDFGQKRLAIDTGSEFTVIKPNTFESTSSFKVETEIFEINEYNFGKHPIVIFEMFDKDFNLFDGVLGLDFLEKHQLLLDFENNKAYISR